MEKYITGTPTQHKSAIAAFIGLPNVGKSTLLNALTGRKLSIVSHHPHTTRRRVMGVIYHDDTQLVLCDTPGFSQSLQHAINRAMQKHIFATLDEVDILVWILRCDHNITQNYQLWESMQSDYRSIPLIIVTNQIDRLPHHTNILPMLAKIHDIWGENNYQHIIPISAKRETNIERLSQILANYAPRQEWLYPKDFITEQPETWYIAEIIREKILWQTRGEVPHQFGVEIEKISTDKKNIWHIHALITVERQGQKSIILGHKGKAIKNAATKARLELEKYFKTNVMLNMFVQVRRNWYESQVKRIHIVDIT